jgi:multiple sugar transport system ATP-binding protein
VRFTALSPQGGREGRFAHGTSGRGSSGQRLMRHIQLQNVSKSFAANTILHNVDLTIQAGQFLSVVGPSGCGKSTLLRIISGLETQTEGSVFINGRCVDGARAADRDLAMVFQSYALYPHMSVLENIALPLTMRELNSAQRLPLIGRYVRGTRARHLEIASRVRDVARQVGILELLDRKPGQLSGGQRQRVALARALIRRPQAFLLDEPLSNLDAGMRSQIRTEISDLHRRLGATMIYVTHDQTEAMALSDQIAVLLAGRLQQVGTPRTIYEAPATLEIAGFFGDPPMNRLLGVVRSDGAVDAQGLILPMDTSLAAGTQVTVGIRPEHLTPSIATGRESWSGVVSQLEYLGSSLHTRVTLRSGARILAQTSPGTVPAEVGREVCVTPVLERVLLFDRDGRRLQTTSAASVLSAGRVIR